MRFVLLPEIMAEQFAAAFSSVFSTDTPCTPASHQCFVGELTEATNFYIFTVAKSLETLNTSSSMGPDNLHPFLLKHCSDSLATPIFCLFLKSLEDGALPSLWKTSLVVPRVE